MRLLLVTNTENRMTTGMGKWSHRIAAALREQGHEVVLWFAEDFPALQAHPRLGVLLFPPLLAARLVRERARFDVAVVHEPSGLWYGLSRQVAARLPPLVLMCHNVESKVFRERVEATARGAADVPLSSRLKAPLFRLWQSDSAIRLADHVLCLSRRDASWLSERLGVPGERITSFINGVGPEDFVERPERPAGQRVLFVGGWLDVKGSRVLPGLWRRVLERLPGARLTLIGTGRPAEEVLRDFEPGARPSMEVLPKVGEGGMAAQYARHDVLLMPSLTEGSPLSLLEAMAAGLPVVAARTGGIPDIVVDGENGLLFEVMDAGGGAERVVRVLGDEALARRLSAAGRERARQLTWQAAAEAVQAAAEKAMMVVEKRSSPA